MVIIAITNVRREAHLINLRHIYIYFHNLILVYTNVKECKSKFCIVIEYFANHYHVNELHGSAPKMYQHSLYKLPIQTELLRDIHKQ